MNTFQLVGLSLVAVLVAFSLYGVVRRRRRLFVSIIWLLVWCMAAAALLRPELTVLAARSMGIGRGADLVFYCNVLLTLAGFFMVYIRQRRIERYLTLLVRELALSKANSPPTAESPPAPLPEGTP